MLTDYHKDFIDKFLIGKLDEEEISEFETLKKNPEFEVELILMIEIQKMAIVSGRQNIKEKLEVLFNEEKTRKINFKSTIGYLKYPIAASIIFIFGISVVLHKEFRSSSDKYFSKGGGASLVKTLKS